MSAAENNAVFLSYASQDAEAARRICDALRAGGVEVWFDRSELRGGDAWDAKIRKQIKECALFVPVISANTQARREGYFRREWKLAVDRTHDMDEALPFLVPVVIDDTKDLEAFVPEKFREVQWTRLLDASATDAFCAQVDRLLGSSRRAETVATDPVNDTIRPARTGAVGARSKAVLWAAILIAVLALTWAWRQSSAPATASARSGLASEAQTLIAKAWAQMNDPGMFRVELEIAEELCKRAIALAPDDPEVWAAASHVDTWFIYRSIDRSPERREAARTKAARALRIAPNSFEARLAEACYLVRAPSDSASGRVSGYATSAESTLRVLLTERPDEPRACFALGILLRNKDAIPEAIEVFDRMAKSPAFASTAWAEKGWLYWIKGKYRDAETACAQSIERQSFRSNLLLRIYLCLGWTGDLDLAKATIEQIPAGALLEDDFSVFAARVYWWRREPARMLEVLAGVPRAWLGWWNLPKGYLTGHAQRLAGKEPAAIVAWTDALREVELRLVKAPESGSLLWTKATLLGLLGRRQEAQEVAMLAGQFGSSAGGAFALVKDWSAALAIGDHETALKSLETAYADKSGWVTSWAMLRFNPQFDALRNEPRFQALLARAQADPERCPQVGAGKVAQEGADPKSIAVLAFDNLSDDKTNEYFSDGISEELINLLGRVPGLMVKGRTSAFYFKDKKASSAEIAEQLGVAYLVRGGVRKFGNKVRITAQLTRAASDEVVWSSEPLTREMENVLAVQEEIAGLIAASLQLKLAASGRATKAVHPEAHRLLLKGRHFWNQRSEQSLVQAEAAFRQALALVPEFAEAHAGIADVYQVRLTNWMNAGEEKKAMEDIQTARHAARRAIEIDPSLAEPYATLGYATFNDGSLQEAAALLQRSLALNPNLAVARRYYVPVLSAQGRIDLAIEEARRAVEIDPLSMMNCTVQARTLGHAQRYAEAEAATARALRLQTDEGPWPRWPRPISLWFLGRRAEATEEARVILRSVPYTDVRGSGDAEALWVLRMAGLPEEVALHLKNLEARLAPDSYLRGFGLMAAGRTDEAWPYLQRMTRGNALNFPLYSVIFDSLRGEPRFTQLIERLGFTEEYKLARATLARMQGEQPTRKP